MPIKYMFCFICCKQCIKISSSRKKCSLFSSVFQENYSLNALPLLFNKCVGSIYPSHFVDGIRTYNGIALIITKLIDNDFYSQGIFTFLFVSVFN